MRLLVLSLISLLSFQVHALQIIKCGSMEGKTLYATFGKRVTSGETPKVVYFPLDFVVFSNRSILQDRVIYDRTQDALKIPLQVSDAAIAFQFEEKSADGKSTVTETFNLHLISPKDLKGFQGRWVTTDADGRILQSVFTMCSAYP